MTGVTEDQPTTRAAARGLNTPEFLPLWLRRIFYIIGVLAGAGGIIIGQYDGVLAANIAGAGALIVSSLALANPTTTRK